MTHITSDQDKYSIIKAKNEKKLSTKGNIIIIKYNK